MLPCSKRLSLLRKRNSFYKSARIAENFSVRSFRKRPELRIKRKDSKRRILPSYKLIFRCSKLKLRTLEILQWRELFKDMLENGNKSIDFSRSIFLANWNINFDNNDVALVRLPLFAFDSKFELWRCAWKHLLFLVEFFMSNNFNGLVHCETVSPKRFQFSVRFSSTVSVRLAVSNWNFNRLSNPNSPENKINRIGFS